MDRGRSFITVSLRWESSCHIFLTLLLSHTCNFLAVLFRTFFPPESVDCFREEHATLLSLFDMQKEFQIYSHARALFTILFIHLSRRVLSRDETSAAGGTYRAMYYLNRGIFPHVDACNVTAKVRNERMDRRMDERTDGRTDSVSERSRGEPEPPL